MYIRGFYERIIQTLAYETGGILIATPVYSLVMGERVSGSLRLLVALSIINVVWSPVHNTIFDTVEARLFRRIASDRPHSLRLVHAITHEASSIFVTLPLIMTIGNLGFWAAAATDVGLTLLYVGYAYVFHVAFDFWRPVRS